MISMRIDIEDLKRGLQAVTEEIPSEVIDGLDHAKSKFLKGWRNERLQGPPGVKARPSRGGGIFVRFQSSRIRSGSGAGDRVIGLRIGTSSKIAILQEEGGEARAKSGEMAVPLQARSFMFLPNPITGALRGRYADPAEVRNTVPVKFKGQTFLTRFKRKDHSNPEPLFVLKKSVTLKPRLGYVDTFNKMESVLYGILSKSFLRGWKKTWGK